MRRHPTLMVELAALACTVLMLSPLPAQGPGVILPPAAQALNLRMQRVLARFVEETGQSVMGVGSWISGSFNSATSDFDMRLIVEEATGPTQQAMRWREARTRLTTLIQDEFGAESRGLLARTNLYPPSQLMAGVEDTADAIERFQRLNTVPSLSHTGPVTAKTPAKFAEGLYGAGSQTYVQGYERKAGRLFYNNNGRAVTGLSELAHLGEAAEQYTAAGSANTAGQWAEHAFVELQAGRGDKVAKYLERLERDLIKSRSRSGLPLDEAFRAQLKGMRDILKSSPGRISEVSGDVARILSRGRAEAAILGRFENAGPMRRAYLRVMLDGVAAGNKVGVLLDRVMAKMPSWVDADNAMNVLVFAIGTQAASQSLGRGDDVFEGMSNVFGAVSPFTLIGPALLAETMAEIIVQAKANGYDMAAGFQDAWVLMSGIYSAWGRAGVDPDPRRKLTLADMVARFQDEDRLEALVMSQAIRASTRDLGTASEQSDNGVALAIFSKCWPVIRDAWKWERDSLATEYLTLASGAVHVPVVLYFKPVQPRTGEAINVEAVSADRKLGDRLERMKQIVRILYGPGSGITVNYYWTPAGSAGQGRDYQRMFTFADPGKQVVKVRMEMSPFTPHTETERRVMLKREVEALVDIDVEGDKNKAAPTSATNVRKYVNVGFSFTTPAANFAGPPGLGIQIDSAEGGSFNVECPPKLSGATITCSGQRSDSNISKAIKGTFTFGPAGDSITSFSFESETVNFMNQRIAGKAVGVNVPLTERWRSAIEWDMFSVTGPEVCKHMTLVTWSQTWNEGHSVMSNYPCTADTKLRIRMGLPPTGPAADPVGPARR